MDGGIGNLRECGGRYPYGDILGEGIQEGACAVNAAAIVASSSPMVLVKLFTFPYPIGITACLTMGSLLTCLMFQLASGTLLAKPWSQGEFLCLRSFSFLEGEQSPGWARTGDCRRTHVMALSSYMGWQTEIPKNLDESERKEKKKRKVYAGHRPRA
eukprot:1143396-Pelagomonas_calceolata.AAC.1